MREGFVVCCGRVKPRLAKCERGMSKPQREAEWGYGDIQMWNGTGNHGHINHVEMVSKISKVSKVLSGPGSFQAGSRPRCIIPKALLLPWNLEQIIQLQCTQGPKHVLGCRRGADGL